MEYLRGRTASEVADLTDRMYRQMNSGYGQPQPAPAPQQQPVAAALPTDEEWISNPSAAFARAAQQMATQQFGPQMQQAFQGQASTNRALVAQKYGDDFRKYGPEIDMLVNQLDPAYRTYDNLERIVKMVRSDHIDEIADVRAEEKIRSRMQAGSGGLRPDGAVAAFGGGVGSEASPDYLASPELPADYKQILAGVNLTPASFTDFLRKYYGPQADLNKAAKDWFDKAKTGKVIAENRSGWRMERTLTPK